MTKDELMAEKIIRPRRGLTALSNLPIWRIQDLGWLARAALDGEP